MSGESTLRIFHTAEEAARAVAAAFASAARRATEDRGRFAVALSGGTTPRPVYELLASEHRDAIPWSRIHFFWSDERFVPRDDPESNFRMAREAFLDAVPLRKSQLHLPPAPPGDVGRAAERYEEDILAFFRPASPVLDWTFLGLGEDGHVASIFPGSPALLRAGTRLVLPVETEAKPPPLRLTMTLELINRSREVHVLAFGEPKRDILREVFAGGTTLPAQRVRTAAGPPVWWVDRSAAPEGSRGSDLSTR